MPPRKRSSRKVQELSVSTKKKKKGNCQLLGNEKIRKEMKSLYKKCSAMNNCVAIILETPNI